MIINYITYGLLAVLLLAGGKFAWRKGEFHEDSASLEVTKNLRGFAAIGVLIHHISQNQAFQMANGYNRPGILFGFVNAGYLFVAIFFFCSGFGLIKSLMTKENYFDGFIKKRVVKTLVIPFYINVVLYAIFIVATGQKLAVQRWIANFLGLCLMNEYAWFPIVCAILYLAFYFIFKNIKNRPLCYGLMLAVILLQGVFFSINGHFAWWSGPKNWWLNPALTYKAKWWQQQGVIWFFGEWWVNSSIAFFIGMLFAQFEEKIRNWFKKLYWLKLILVIVLYLVARFCSMMAQGMLGYWSEFSGKGPGILNKFICYCVQLPEVSLFVIMIFAIMLVYKVQNPVLKFFGNVSFETYMMNLIPITVFDLIIFQNKLIPGLVAKPGNTDVRLLGLYAVAVIATTVLLGLLFKFLCKIATKRIK